MAKVKNRRDNHATKRNGYQVPEKADGHTKKSYSGSRSDSHTSTRSVSHTTTHSSTRSGSRSSSYTNSHSRPEKKPMSDFWVKQENNHAMPEDYAKISNDGNITFGRNPVLEALRSGREIDKILVSSTEGSVIKILGQAKEKGIPVMRVEKAALDRIANGAAHQGVAAYISPYNYSEMSDIFALAEERGEDPFIMILDGFEDPHNLGAVIRSAECAGAHGIIIPKRRACGLTETVAKTSAGAIEYVPVVKVTNIAQTIDELKEKGIFVAACDMGGKEYYNCDITGKIAIVVGSEGFGISKLVKEKCDFVVSMPMKGKITSLNASNAAAIIAYEVRRQRDLAKAEW